MPGFGFGKEAADWLPAGLKEELLMLPAGIVGSILDEADEAGNETDGVDGRIAGIGVWDGNGGVGEAGGVGLASGARFWGAICCRTGA